MTLRSRSWGGDSDMAGELGFKRADAADYQADQAGYFVPGVRHKTNAHAPMADPGQNIGAVSAAKGSDTMGAPTSATSWNNIFHGGNASMSAAPLTGLWHSLANPDPGMALTSLPASSLPAAAPTGFSFGAGIIQASLPTISDLTGDGNNHASQWSKAADQNSSILEKYGTPMNTALTGHYVGDETGNRTNQFTTGGVYSSTPVNPPVTAGNPWNWNQNYA